jgi:hypothetical protein
MKGMIGFAGAAVISIYLAGVLQGHGVIAATDQVMWLLGAAILGTVIGILLFDP